MKKIDLLKLKLNLLHFKIIINKKTSTSSMMKVLIFLKG